MSDKNEIWKTTKEYQENKGDTPDSSKDFARADHQARNDYQDDGEPFGPLDKRDRSSKEDVPSRGSGGGRVICTHFFKKGLLSRRMLLAEIQFTDDHINPAVVRGYHFWAIPYVRLMRRNKLAERLIYPLMKWRGEEIAFQMKLRPTGNLKGKVIRLIGESICWVIGNFVRPQDWESLWAEEQTQAV